MKNKIIPTLITTTLLTAFLITTLNPLNTANATATIIQLKWVNTMNNNDIKVSKDSNYLTAVNNTGLYYFDTDSPHPIWWYQPSAATLESVAISNDGDYVVAGDNNGYLHYFNQSTQRTDNQTTPTWTSNDLGGAIERGTLDMSANGNYTVVGGTGTNIWYYAGCTTRTGQGQSYTWIYGAPVNDFYTVHISPNGKYVAGGGVYSFMQGFVVFYKDADTATGYYTPTWLATNETDTPIIDLALSDDGYAVAAVGVSIATLYYWADATNLTDDPNATWTNPGLFGSVDMSANGDNVVAGGYSILRSLHFWANARTRNETQTEEDWARIETTIVLDVATSNDGNIIAASARDEAYNNIAYFFTADGNEIDEYPLAQLSPMVSMSGDGTTIAIAGPGPFSLYLFKTAVDSTPPDINDVWQQPANDSVTPTDMVNVFANITDDLSGIKQITLNYTTGNGTWFTTTMELYDTDIYNGTIPAFPYCNTITYIIIAEDYANNTITSQDLGYTLQYHVIPEFTPTMLMLSLMTATLISAAAYKKKRKL